MDPTFSQKATSSEIDEIGVMLGSVLGKVVESGTPGVVVGIAMGVVENSIAAIDTVVSIIAVGLIWGFEAEPLQEVIAMTAQSIGSIILMFFTFPWFFALSEDNQLAFRQFALLLLAEQAKLSHVTYVIATDEHHDLFPK